MVSAVAFALALPLVVAPAMAQTPLQLNTTSPYPVDDTASRSLTPTVSVYPGQLGSVEFELYNAEQTTRLADGPGTVGPDGRASWTVPSGVLADAVEYAWRSRAVGGGQVGNWSELHPIVTDSVDGVALPSSPPSPGAVDGLVVTPAAGGAYLTWQGADGGPGAIVTHYVVQAWRADGGGSPAAEVVVAATEDHAVVSGLFDQFEYRFGVTAHNEWNSGPGAGSGALRPAAAPLPAATFTAMATSYITARGKLSSGATNSPSRAVDESPHADVIREAVLADGPADVKEREHLVKENVLVTSHAAEVSDVAVVPGQGETVTVHANVFEKLDQEAVVSSTEKVKLPEERLRRFTFTFVVKSGASKLTSVTTPKEGEGQPDAVVETPTVKPVEMDENGFTEGPEIVSAAAAVNHARISSYARVWALKDNPHYKIKGNDCTNFISQALRHGYFPRRLGPYRSESVWWYNGAWPIYGSWTWYAAHNSFNHMWKKNRAVFRSHTNQAVPGDILYFDFQNDGKIDHAAVVTNVQGYHVWYAQHQPKLKYRHLQKVLAGSPSTRVYLAHMTG